MKYKNNFCSSSCAAIYNNTHKTYGTRRSKLEKYLEEKLKEKYPKLDIHFNRKDAINSELDIYIPSLKLAFELNGIYHYEPIHGPEKLASVQNNDQRKFQACLERGIELCIIDTSSIKHFKENKANKFLNIIIEIISKRQ
jgi:very-short-patch-repair endonuclease